MRSSGIRRTDVHVRKSRFRLNRFQRPVASIEFGSKYDVWIELRPYINSGADITLIPLIFGRLLGLELKKEEIKHLRGIGGVGMPVVIKEVDTRINGTEFPVRVAWALEEDLPPLLGSRYLR
ncbi:MAG: hypothetical protein C4B59_13480 [Candidatus Methanogaster sp.]|uniref:Uncharacterized protein n=1 Tax=Candidatus Methanogaster sp. TaxID=3386292 RepID=A0AC61KZZ3_9EURY|nr:MAG: hypothetical protein C4B59_13480 [ANME-2 cluster archaeon]